MTETPSQSSHQALPVTGVFVGRQRELAALTAALDAALSGQGRLSMLVGEPGIGKTRTTQELASYAVNRGAQVFWGRCYEEAGTPPYWPWVQAMRSYVQQASAEQLIAEMGPGAAAIAEIVAELQGKIPHLETLPALEPEQARFRLFDSIATFLKNVSRAQPLVLVLDDLHWADESSLLLLEFLSREISASSVMVVGTYRDNEVTGRHPLVQTLGNLVREPHFHRLSLGGLSREEVGKFVEARAGVEVGSAAVDTLHQRTGGNPLFIGEVVGSVGPEELVRDQTWMASIPDAVREAILRRLSRLSEVSNQVLRTASVIGRDFDIQLLRVLSPEIAEDQFLESLDEALGERMIESLPGEPGRYQFGHALIQQAVYEEIPPMRKAQAHAATGSALEELHQNNLGEHAAGLAHHFAEAVAVLGIEKQALYSLMAGERALAAYAYGDAIGHFERGLVGRGVTMPGTDPAFDDETASALFGLARARSATGLGHQLVEAFDILSRAFEYYAEVGNVDLAVATAAFPIAGPAIVIPGLPQLMARALTLVPPDSHEAGRLLSRYGGTLGAAEGDYEGAQEALGRAIAIARREEDVLLEVQTLTYSAAVNGQNLHPQESIDNGLRAIELATGDENPFSYTASRRWTALSLLDLGEPSAARPHALALRELAQRRSTSQVFVGRSFGPITYLSCLEGNWNAGREYSDQGLAVSPLEMTLIGTRCLLEHETGESAQGEVYLERLLESMRRTGLGQSYVSSWASMVITSVARISGVTDRLEIAQAAADAVVSNKSVPPRVNMDARAALALFAVQAGDQQAAERHYAYLLEQERKMIYTFSSVDRLLGLLAQTLGNVDQAGKHFNEAVAFCRKASYKPELAWVCSDYAETLLGRNGGDGQAKAKSLLQEALSLSSDLGMRPLMDRVTALQERVEVQPVRAPAYPDGLTQREVEVIRLVAAGKTDRQIAEELIISINTVGNHVRSILNKTNSANRTEAAHYASQQGLVD